MPIFLSWHSKSKAEERGGGGIKIKMLGFFGRGRGVRGTRFRPKRFFQIYKIEPKIK